MESLVINNFLPYPNVVRSWALSNEFVDAKEFSKRIGSYTSWPGLRSQHVMELDNDYANVILSQILDISKKFFISNNHSNISIRSFFQVCREEDGDSWIHQDNDVDVAGILYLSPNAPISSGTTLYKCNDYNAWSSTPIDKMMQINRVDQKELYDKLFSPVDIIGNVYNRLVMYKGDIFHKSNDYFGSTMTDSRLTQVFFIKVEK
jgi:hypothetical protein